MRCPDCNKFVSYDDSQEPETNLEVSANGTEATVTGSVRIMLPCAECNTELKEYNFDVEQTVEIPEGHACHVPEEKGCPTHVAGTPCPVCKWNGVAKPSEVYTNLLITRFNPPKKIEPIDVDLIGKVSYRHNGLPASDLFGIGEEEEMANCIDRLQRTVTGIPAQRQHVPAHDNTGYEIEDLSCELTSRSDCGINKRTGKPNKYNHRYATTYYGYSLDGVVKCNCGQVEVEFSASDETAASGMDELV